MLRRKGGALCGCRGRRSGRGSGRRSACDRVLVSHPTCEETDLRAARVRTHH